LALKENKPRKGTNSHKGGNLRMEVPGKLPNGSPSQEFQNSKE